MTLFRTSWPSVCYLLSLLIVLVVVAFVAEAEIPQTGMCDVLIFVPFTYRGYALPFYEGNRKNNLGFSHMAAALLAAKHFNERDISVVPELQENSTIRNCKFRFDFNGSFVFDSEIFSQAAARQMQGHVIQAGGVPPCSVVGAFFDQPAQELSVLSSTFQIPFVSYRIMDPAISIDSLYPYTIQTNGASTAFAKPLMDYLNLRGRTNHISFLSAGTPEAAAMTEAYIRKLRSANIQTFSVNYLTRGLEPGDDGDATECAETSHFVSLRDAIEQIKSIGFRTVVVIASESDIAVDIPIMASEAENQGMNTGQYFWLFVTGLSSIAYSSNLTMAGGEGDNLIKKFFRGSASIDYADGFVIDNDEDAFLKSWRSQNSTFLDIVREKNPIPVGSPGYYDADDDYFQTVDPEPGASFLYDAVMSIGIGGCLQTESIQGGNVVINGSSHLSSIKAANFTGASGNVIFGSGPYVETTGVRRFSSAMYVARNLIPPGSDETSVVTEILDESGSSVTIPPGDDPKNWISVEKFIFGNGKTTGPILRDTPEQNYLSRKVRAVGLTLMTTAVAAAFASIVWILLKRGSRVVAAAQPWMIIILLCGVIVESFTILTQSFDESYGFTSEQLSRFCLASPWLFVIGCGTIYAALFAKLWRIHKVLQFRRVKMTWKQAIWPVSAFFFASIVNLTVWTIIGEFEWIREEVNDVTGESFGSCQFTNRVSGIAFVTFQSLFIGVPVILSLIWAWKTKDVDESFSDSSWIFTLVFVQLQTAIVGIPLFIILKDLSTNGRYIGFVLLIWMHCMSAVVMIVVPKILAFYRPTQERRGTRAGTRISGLTLETPENKECGFAIDGTSDDGCKQ